MAGSAALSSCETYRYYLSRVWDRDRRLVLWVMHNPSTADASVDDPTIRRCVGFAKLWGYGGIAVVNLFAYRATNPKDLIKTPDPIGPDNHHHLRKALDHDRHGLVIAAWGNVHPRLREQRDHVCGWLEAAVYGPPTGFVDAAEVVCRNVIWCLGFTKNREPRHPLMVRKNQALAAFMRTQGETDATK